VIGGVGFLGKFPTEYKTAYKDIAPHKRDHIDNGMVQWI
jgi:hypothetical protein